MSHFEIEETPSDLQAFRQSVAAMSERQARAKFPEELICFKTMWQRHASSGAIVAQEFRSFKCFLIALGQPRPNREWTVDRIDTNDPEYGPDKVRWADKRQQANNRRNTTFLINRAGDVRPLADWARLTGQNAATLRQRLKRGWTHDEIIKGRRAKPGQDTKLAGNAKPNNNVRSRQWPEGITASLWEPAYQVWCRVYPPQMQCPTREVFLCWLASNQLGRLQATLEVKHRDFFLGLDNTPDDEVPEHVSADPTYQTYLRYKSVHNTALAHVMSNPNEIAAFHELRRYPGKPGHPAEIADFIRERNLRMQRPALPRNASLLHKDI